MKEQKIKMYEVEIKALVYPDMNKKATKQDIENNMNSISCQIYKLKVIVK